MASEQVLYNITGKRSLSEASVDNISTIVNEYPFFSPAQFILALKQKGENGYNYSSQLQKASLYFSNQVWLNYLLSEKEVAKPQLNLRELSPIVELPQQETHEEDIFPKAILGSHLDQTSNHFDEEVTKEPVSPVKEEPELEESSFDYSSLFTNTSNIEIPTLEQAKQLLDGKHPENYTVTKSANGLPTFPSILKEPIATAVTEPVPARIPSFSFLPKVEETVAEPAITPVDEEKEIEEPIIETSSSIHVSEPLEAVAAADVATEVFETPSPIVEHQVIIAPVVEKAEEVEEVVENKATEIPSYSFKGFSQDVNHTEDLTDAVSISEAYAKEHYEHHEHHTEEEEADAEIESTEYDNNNISSLISTQAVDFNKPVDKDAKLDFENENRLYTIDYFESQGIKIDLTKQPQDKLTMQMRRFTDWLKQMKTTDPNPQDLGTDPELEKAIQNIAKTSIEAKEIVTETMADVFIKQGKVSKAIQLYIKLSFLDPSKSTYFANKIQQLKGI